MSERIGLLLVVVLIVFGCREKKPKTVYRQIAGLAQGTTYHMTYEDPQGRDLTPLVDSILNDFDLTFSVYNPGSIISRINANDSTVVVNDQFVTLYNKSIEVNRDTQGDFDLTVAPLVDAWGFGPGKKQQVDKLIIDSIMPLVGMNKIRLVGNRLIKNDPRIRIDVNSIAQGYSVDLIYEYFKTLGLKNFMVEIGGEVRVSGKNSKGGLWRIGIDKPVEGSEKNQDVLQDIIFLDEQAVTTSGNYRKYFEEKGQKFSHIIDPHTGYPYKNKLLSVTVMAKDALTADGYDTGLMVMGLERTREFLKHHPELDAYIIYADDAGQFQIEYTKGFKFDR